MELIHFITESINYVEEIENELLITITHKRIYKEEEKKRQVELYVWRHNDMDLELEKLKLKYERNTCHHNEKSEEITTSKPRITFDDLTTKSDNYEIVRSGTKERVSFQTENWRKPTGFSQNPIQISNKKQKERWRQAELITQERYGKEQEITFDDSLVQKAIHNSNPRDGQAALKRKNINCEGKKEQQKIKWKQRYNRNNSRNVLKFRGEAIVRRDLEAIGQFIWLFKNSERTDLQRKGKKR
ncbi:hypothetical protein NPIL_664061, partial [Nephila pilipes]